MKKIGLFIFVFTFSVLIFSFSLKAQYVNLSNKIFSKITQNINSGAENLYAALSRRELLDENENLKKELSKSNFYKIENKLLKNENDDLYKLLSLKKNSSYKVKANAKVIKINSTGNFTLTVDCGKNQGIKKDDVAIWGNALVGRVTECFDSVSIVTPISAPQISTGIVNEKEDAGLITGKMELYKSNMCDVSFFSNTAQKPLGSIVTTSGLSDTYPKGLLVGTIKKRNADTVIKTEVDFFKIRSLSLIASE